MTRPAGWNARAALAGLDPIPWAGRAWRLHRRRYSGTDPAGSLTVSGRYHRASDQFPADQTWPALYLALTPEGSLGEFLRHFGPELMLRLNEYRLTDLEVELAAAFDCRDASALGLAPDALVGDYDFTTTQEIAAAASDKGAEGLLVPSATGLGDNLVIFPSQLGDTSRLVVTGSRDPRLYVPR